MLQGGLTLALPGCVCSLACMLVRALPRGQQCGTRWRARHADWLQRAAAQPSGAGHAHHGTLLPQCSR